MNKKRNQLTVREKNFCIFYAYFGNAAEAAARAGYKQPEKEGIRLLARGEIGKELEKLTGKQQKRQCASVLSGYERLAFGSVEGAVRLLFAEDPMQELENGYSLFNVAEIKRPKENALEIKFFDRMKALEKLEQHQSGQKHGASDFYEAVIGGIADAAADRGREDE